ncbi:MAG: hypothetical protein ABEJ92_03785 [Halobacteriales archaeon]
MKRKPLPAPPDDLAALREAHAAVPLVPGSEADCCARLQRRLDLPSRDVAGTWLAFLEGLGLVEAGTAGYTRVRVRPDRAALAERFLAGVYGARAALDALAGADGPLDADGVAARTADRVTGWERRRHGREWRAVWRDRTVDLLGWLALLDLAERADGGYRPAAD